MIPNPFRFILFLYAFVGTFLCGHALYLSYTISPSPYNLKNILICSLVLNSFLCLRLFLDYKKSLKG